MPDYDELMHILSTPRPNGSQAERETARALKDWLGRKGIPYQVHTFRHYPYFFEAIGAWLIASRLLLALAIWLRWGWAASAIALIGIAGGTLDSAFHLPLVSWPGMKTGENLLIDFSPPNPRQELILSAHYDSKTELLDHHQRMFFLTKIPTGLLLTAILGILGPLDRILWVQGSPSSTLTYILGIGLSLVLLVLAGGYGINLVSGRFVRPSLGVIDNGAACAILLGLAERLNSAEGGPFTEKVRLCENDPPGKLHIKNTRLVLALFTGEEVDRQGSAAYARRFSYGSSAAGSDLPAAVLNLEIMAQNGDYVIWEKDGSVFRLAPTDTNLNRALCSAVKEVTGKEPVAGGPVLSDAAPFLKAGLPVSVLGTYDSHWRDTGFHRPSDNLDRLVIGRLEEGVDILERFFVKVDEEQVVIKKTRNTRNTRKTK